MFLEALLLTSAVELVVILIILKLLYKRRLTLKTAFVAIMGSSFTLPYVWFVFPFLFEDKNTYLLFAEVFVVVVEAFVYNVLLKIKVKHVPYTIYYKNNIYKIKNCCKKLETIKIGKFINTNTH